MSTQTAAPAAPAFLVCHVCKRLVAPVDHTCKQCGALVHPEERDMTVAAFGNEQSKLRKEIGAGRLTSEQAAARKAWIRGDTGIAAGAGDDDLDAEVDAFEELTQTRAAIWTAAAMLVTVTATAIIFHGFSGFTTGAVVIDVIIIAGLLRGENWARLWMLFRVIVGILVFGGMMVTQDNPIGALLQVGLLGPVALLLTGSSTRNRMTTAVAVFGASFAGFITLGVTTFAATALEVGDCFNLPSGTQPDVVSNLPKATCSGPYDVEVFAVLDYPTTGDDYPGDVAVFETSARACMSPFESFVDSAYEDTPLDIYVVHPSAQTWRMENDRSIVCGVYRPDGEKLVGSAEGLGGAEWTSTFSDYGITFEYPALSVVETAGTLTSQATERAGGVNVFTETGVFGVEWLAISEMEQTPYDFAAVFAMFEEEGLVVVPGEIGQSSFQGEPLLHQTFTMSNPSVPDVDAVPGVLANTTHRECGLFLVFSLIEVEPQTAPSADSLVPYLDSFQCS